jgi:hypothetical protein
MSKQPTKASEPLASKSDKDIRMLTPESSPGTSPQKTSTLAGSVDEKMKMKMKTSKNENFDESMIMNVDTKNASSGDEVEKMKMKLKMKMKIEQDKGVASDSVEELEKMKMKMKMKMEQEKGTASSSINIPASTEEQENLKMKMSQKDTTPGTSPEQSSEDMKMKMNMKMKTGSKEMDVSSDSEEEKIKMKMKMKMNINANPTDSLVKNLTQTTMASSSLLKTAKPPNVLVYSEVTETRNALIQSLEHILGKDIYTIYPLTQEVAQRKIWIENTTLLIVCGNVADEIRQILLEFLLTGGKLLSLCSNLLHTVLPTFQNSQVWLLHFSIND